MPKSGPRNIEVFDGRVYELPDQPADHFIIGNRNLRKHQKWGRQELPDLDKIPSYERDTYIQREFMRLENGVWFYNDGEPTYITGKHYYFLQYWVLDDGTYPNYRECDRNIFYYWDMVERDKKALGLIWIKHRRRGASSVGSALSANIATAEYNVHCGTISKTGEDAEKIYAQMIVNGVRGLPFYLKPRFGAKGIKNELRFGEPPSSRNILKKDEGLNSYITWLSTSIKSYDGRRMRYMFLDEVGKWEEVDFNKYYEVARTCCTKGAVVVGKVFATSTVGEMTKGGGENLRLIWHSSRPESNSKGLYRYFAPAYDGYEGFIDEYGRSIIEDPDEPVLNSMGEYVDIGAKTHLAQLRKSYEDNDDLVGLAEHKRQFPWTIEEAFSVGGHDCHFIAEHIQSQLEFLHAQPKKLTQVGTLDWADADHKTVKFTPNKSGFWEILRGPKMPNRTVNKGGIIHPADNTIFVGADPFNNSEVMNPNKASKGAITVYDEEDPNDPENTGLPLCIYKGRPPTPQLYFEDAIKTMVWYSGMINCERSPSTMVDYLVDSGYGGYVARQPASTIPVNDKLKRRLRGTPGAGAYVINAHLTALQEYMYSKTHKIYFVSLLEDLLKFDVNNRREFDLTMSFGYALLLALGQSRIVEQQKTKALKPFIKVYET